MTEHSTLSDPSRRDPRRSEITRRTLSRGAAWAAPAVAMGFAAPAFASSMVSYTMAGSVRTEFTTNQNANCQSGYTVRSLRFMNSMPTSPYPAGFSVYEKPRTAGTSSPRTTATITRYRLTVYMPQNWVATGYGTNGFAPDNPTAFNANWTGPVVGSTTLLGQLYYTPFTFTFIGQKTGPTYAATTPPQAWPGSDTISGGFWVNPVCTMPNTNQSYYWSFDRGFTTANGDSYALNNSSSPILQVMYPGA